MDSFFNAKTQGELAKIAKAKTKVADDAAALQQASQKAEELKLKEVGIQVDAIADFRNTKSALDKAISEAYAKGGKVTIKISAQPASADEAVEMEIDLSNTEINRNQQIQTHRAFVHTNLIGAAAQQASLVENQIKSTDPVAYHAYVSK